MTIGIGVLCSSLPEPHIPRPDTIILLSDTMGSTDTDSVDELHKMFIDEESGFYAVCAGRCEKAADLMPMIKSELLQLPARTHGTFIHALNKAANDHRTQHFAYDVRLPKYTVEPQRVLQADEMLKEFQSYSVGAELLVGLFDDAGMGLLYYVGAEYGGSLVHLCQFPGYLAIGSGAYNATFWLNFRAQSQGGNVLRSSYHVLEAARMAARSPTVNEKIEMVIASAGGFNVLTSKEPEKVGCPISLNVLEDMWEKFKPRSTKKIGILSK